MHILFIHIRYPEFDRCSGDVRLSNLLRILARKHQVTLHVLYKDAAYLDAAENKKYVEALTSAGIAVTHGGLHALLQGLQFDAILIEFWYVARPILKSIRVLQPSARIVVDTEHVYFHSEFLKAKALGEALDSPELAARKRGELETYVAADLVITTTEEDKGVLLNEIPRLNAYAIPNIHEIPDVGESASARSQDSLIFVGNFQNNPSNVDAMTYFCSQVLPLIRSEAPDTSLAIVGNKPPAEIQNLACEYITVTGYVPDTAPYLAEAMVSICPLRFGAGLKGKIGEAMMHGLPVVTTSIGTQGMARHGGVELLVGDTPTEFANAVLRLFRDPHLWKTLSNNGRKLIVETYSFAAVEANVDAVMRAIDNARPKRMNVFRRIPSYWRLRIATFLERNLNWRLRKT